MIEIFPVIRCLCMSITDISLMALNLFLWKQPIFFRFDTQSDGC